MPEIFNGYIGGFISGEGGLESYKPVSSEAKPKRL
jgi:hypothetical protein